MTTTPWANYRPAEKRTYVFVRADMFYMIELWDDADACVNAEINPGTVRVEDVTGRLVWGEVVQADG